MSIEHGIRLKLSYTGIGSRRAPYDILNLCSELASTLEQDGYILRTGGAVGCDKAFENGVLEPANMEIYRPLIGNEAELPSCDTQAYLEQALDIAQKCHPSWDQLTPYTKALMARNSHQILGVELQTPSSFVLCWTPNGSLSASTTNSMDQALRVADVYHVPVFNMNNIEWLDAFRHYAEENHLTNTLSCLYGLQEMISWRR